MTDIIDAVDPVTEARASFTRVFEFRAEPSDDGLTLEGYAAVFNSPTEINSWEGVFTETIKPGAFKRSIDRSIPVLQFDHGHHPLIGSIPIGVIRSLREDSHGLRVKARLSDNWLVEPVRDAIRDGAVTGMSFRFQAIRDKWSPDRSKRDLLELAVPELGPVVFPAYAATSVGVRAAGALDALTDPEVRAEIARLLVSGTDLRSLADTTDPASSHSEGAATDPASSHSAADARAVAQAIARARAALLTSHL